MILFNVEFIVIFGLIASGCVALSCGAICMSYHRTVAPKRYSLDLVPWQIGAADKQAAGFRRAEATELKQRVPRMADGKRGEIGPLAHRLRFGGDARMVSGNVAIHINGGSHDPEALATLIQRRINESMNWRAHDSESEYT